jgi:hypothetical protein
MVRKSKVDLSANIKTLLDKEKPERKKIKRSRKPMTPEQKAAASLRLEKARAKRKPAKGKTFHLSVYDVKTQFKPLKDVQKWLKEAKEQAYSAKKDMSRFNNGSKEWSIASDRYLFWYGYVNDINWYLRHGDWISNTYGSAQQNKTKWKTIVPAFYPDGTRKDQTVPVIIETKAKKRRRKP